MDSTRRARKTRKNAVVERLEGPKSIGMTRAGCTNAGFLRVDLAEDEVILEERLTD